MTFQPTYSDENFRAELVKGYEIEKRIAERIRGWGFETSDPVFEFRKDLSDVARFTEGQTDLIVHGFVYVEIKSRSIKFNDPSSYPFADAALDGAHTYRSKLKRPDFYILHSKPTDAIVAVSTLDEDQWTIRTLPDYRRDIERKTFFAPKSILISEAEFRDRLRAMQLT